MNQKNLRDQEYNKIKRKVEITPGFVMLLQDMESKTESESRDSVLQMQINKINQKVDLLDQTKANRRGRKKKKVKT